MRPRGLWRPGLVYLLAGGTLLAALSGAVQAGNNAAGTPWIAKKNFAKARLIAGRIATSAGIAASRTGTLLPASDIRASDKHEGLYAGVELVIADGWKTYWRNSGDAAGVPPYFDFKASANVKRATVLYPAPHRFKTPDGDSIGYKKRVIFPIALSPIDALKPMLLKLTLDYGICSDICIPARAKFAVTIPPGTAMPLLDDAPLVAALALVPRQPLRGGVKGSRRVPVLKSARAENLNGPSPRLVFDIVYPGGIKGADLFIEGPDEVFVPQPQRRGAATGDRITFVVDLTDGADLAELRGKALRLTLVSDAGNAEAGWVLK